MQRFDSVDVYRTPGGDLDDGTSTPHIPVVAVWTMMEPVGMAESGPKSTESGTAAVPARRWRQWLAGGAVVAAALAAFLAYGAYGPPRDLGQMEARVVARWPGVAHLPRAELSNRLEAGGRDFVVFDVREADEHAVSHLPGAIRISPDITRVDFLAAHGAALAGKTVVFYCAVGVRSSLVIADLDDDLRKAGATRTYNLTGGIFGWHNDGRSLVDAVGSTEHVHGFASRWARLVTRKEFVRMSVK
jgi:rhodanese-related sulfurtransferase